MSDIPALQPIYFSGIRTDVKGNAHYITDNDVLYPNGSVLVLYNYAEKRQKYVRLPDRGAKINMICVSPNRKIIALVESGQPPTISIYDSETLKRKKQISPPADKNVTTSIIETMAFTCDSKSLVVVYGDPDWLLVSFNYEKAKLESSTRANNINNTGTVRQVACNPNDSTVLVLVGEVVFRLLAITESIWRQYGYSKADQLNLICVTWLSQDRVAAGTNDGRILIVENAELKLMFFLDATPQLIFQAKGDEQPSNVGIVESTPEIPFDEMNEIRSIICFPKGFVVAKANGQVHLYEKESQQIYSKRNIFTLVDSVEVANQEPLKLHSITVSPNQDNLILSCSVAQLYWTYMWGPDMTKQPETLFQELGPILHRGPVYAMAVCTWKPILITAGRVDGTVAVWDYEAKDVLLRKVFHEDIYCVDLHPSGLYIVIGFAGKLRYMTLLIDDLAVIKEIPIRYCSVCRFSKQGHLFAAANGNVIQVYSSIHFNNVVNLKGHNGKVTSLSWTLSDYKMISCGTDGAIYEWDMSNGQRTVEIVLKKQSFNETRATSDGAVTYVVGSDGEVKEIVDSNIRTHQKLIPTELDCMELSRSNQMLFVSGQDGTIFSVKLPLREKPAFIEHTMHRTKVTQLRISYDDKYLMSCSVDGTLCFWRLINTMGKSVQLSKDFKPSPDILIAYDDLNEKQQALKDLKTRIYELEKENVFQIKKLETKYTSKAKEIHEAYVEAIQELKHKNNLLEVDHAQKVHSIQLNIAQMKVQHEHQIQATEESYNEKLITEYEKFARLDDRMRAMKKSFEDKLDVTEKEREQKENEIIDDYLQQLHEKDQIIKELSEETEQHIKDHEVIKQQIEDDADREIYEMKARFEAELKDEQNANIKLRSENAVLFKKMNASQKMMDELKHQIFTLDNEHAKFKSSISNLEKEINELKKEIAERDGTIQDKEKKIYDMKRRTQELEKYKFVLEYKLRNSKESEEPRERKIQEQKEQMEDMVTELEALQKEVTTLDVKNKHLHVKLQTSIRNTADANHKIEYLKKIIKNMHGDIFHVSTLIQKTDQLKTAVRKMYHKYGVSNYMAIKKEDCEVRNEFQNQRSYLEKTVDELKTKVSGTDSHGDEERLKMIDESSALVTEINKLRVELNECEKRNKQMEYLIGSHRKPAEARRKFDEILKNENDLEEGFQKVIQDKENIIELLKEENDRLVAKLSTGCQEIELEENESN